MLKVVSTSPEIPAAVTAAARIRSDLSVLEATLDRALGEAARLTQTMIDARRDSGVPVHTGQVALMRLQRAQSQLVAASNDTFRVHDELAKLAKIMMISDDPTPNSGLIDEDANLLTAA